jgi:hypothetical protein
MSRQAPAGRRGACGWGAVHHHHSWLGWRLLLRWRRLLRAPQPHSLPLVLSNTRTPPLRLAASPCALHTAHSRRILDHLVDEAVSNRRFDASLVVRRMVPGGFDAEYPRVADADQCHIVGVQVPEGRGPLPNTVIAMLRSSRSAVLLYRATSGAPGAVAANRSALEQAEADAAAAEAEAGGKGVSDSGSAK